MPTNSEEDSYTPRVFKIKLPMRLRTSSKKKQALNLNVYRNLHFRSLSAQKNKFAKIAEKLLRGMPPLGVITLHYEVHPGSRRRLDIMNVGSIVDKYFSDTLTDCGIIEDDDYTHIPLVTFSFGKLVKKEYILVTITEIKPREKATPMRVLLDNDDIQRALTTYVSSLNIPNATGVRLISDDGLITAEVLFDLDPDAPEVSEEKPKRRRGGRPAGSKNKPKKEEDANVDAPVQTSADDGGPGDTPTAADETPTDDTSPDGAEADPSTKPVSSKNLFGDKESPSSEDDGEATEAAPSDTPEPPVKKGSIFDS